MKQPQLKAGMDCTNLRTRSGTKVISVDPTDEVMEVCYPFCVHFVSDTGKGTVLDNFYLQDGRYWVDLSHKHKYDIFELEEGDEGYVDVEGIGLEGDDSIVDEELREVLNSSLSDALKIKLIKLILIPL